MQEKWLDIRKNSLRKKIIFFKIRNPALRENHISALGSGSNPGS